MRGREWDKLGRQVAPRWTILVRHNFSLSENPARSCFIFDDSAFERFQSTFTSQASASKTKRVNQAAKQQTDYLTDQQKDRPIAFRLFFNFEVRPSVKSEIKNVGLIYKIESAKR